MAMGVSVGVVVGATIIVAQWDDADLLYFFKYMMAISSSSLELLKK